jgi:hypothetical protein
LSARITTRQQQRRAGDMFVLCAAFIHELGRGGCGEEEKKINCKGRGSKQNEMREKMQRKIAFC